MKKNSFLFVLCLSVLMVFISGNVFAQEEIFLEEVFTDGMEVSEFFEDTEPEIPEEEFLPEVSVVESNPRITEPEMVEEEPFPQIPAIEVEDNTEPEEILFLEEILITEEEQQEIVLSDVIDNHLLQNGMTGDAVRSLQQQLIRMGYLSGTDDGIFGSVTEEAVRRYQFYNGQDVTGAADSSLINNISAAKAVYTDLVMGSEGSAVVNLQRALKKLGFDPGEIDGQFGPVTYQAVAEFQTANNLYVDGVVGNETISAIVKLPEITTSVSVEPSTVTASSELKKGMTGNAVVRLQQMLYDKGYMTAPVDGDFGGVTETAVKNYQLYNGLDITGVADQTLLDQIAGNRSPVFADLAIGSEGTAVANLQKALKDLGFDPGEIDGQFGQITYRAVVAYQDANQLYSDGIVGRQTVSAITGSLKAETKTQTSTQTQSQNQLANDQLPAIVVNTEGLRLGSSGDEVLKMQQALAEYGYLDADLDGYFGPMTEKSLKTFEVYNNLGISSTATSDILNRLYSQNAIPYSTLSVGSTGTAVAGIQRVLYNLGYLDVLPDGIYGNVTRNAVALFQEVNDLDEWDGVTDQETIDELTDLQDGYEEEMISITPEQRKLIQTAYQVPTTAPGLCSAWVSNVLDAYGISSLDILSTRDSVYSYAYDNGLTDEYYEYDTDFNANDYWAYVCTSDDLEDLKPGMVIATRSTYSYLGKQFGHVGFYLGNNKVISSIGYIETVDMDVFDEQYNNTDYGSTMRWGFAPTLIH